MKILESAPLQVKNIITTESQVVDFLVAKRFSLKKWLKSIGREYDNDGNYEWKFGFGLGYYEVYKPFEVRAGTMLRMLELAIINLNRYVLVSQFEDFRSVDKLRFGPGQQFMYKEVA